MSLLKLASLEKKAFDPMSIMHGLMHGGQALGHMAGYVPHDLLQTAGNLGEKFLQAKTVAGAAVGAMAGTNLLGGEKMLLRASRNGANTSLLADSLIALKRGTEGKVLAGRSPLGMFAWTQPEMHMKMMALHDVNTLGHRVPGSGKVLFDGNRLNKDVLHNTLETAGDAKDALRANVEQRGARSTALQFARYRRQGLGQEEAAIKSGQYGAKLNSRRQERVLPTHKALDASDDYHKLLSANNGAGYDQLDKAGRSAEIAMNRPKFLNYTNMLYKTPEENHNSVGKYVARTTQTIMGQKPEGVSFGKFLKHGYGEVHLPIDNPPKINMGKLRETLQSQMPNVKVPEKLTPEHAKNTILNLPSMRQDAANTIKNKTTEWSNKIFGK